MCGEVQLCVIGEGLKGGCQMAQVEPIAAGNSVSMIRRGGLWKAEGWTDGRKEETG